MKRLIKALDNARGNGTSMISLIMPPKSQVLPRGCLRVCLSCGCVRVRVLGCWAAAALPPPCNAVLLPPCCPAAAAALPPCPLLSPHVRRPALPDLPSCPPPPPASPRTGSRCKQVAQTQAILANEYGTASNIKSRVNRQSVLAAITSAQQRLKLYTKVGGQGGVQWGAWGWVGLPLLWIAAGGLGGGRRPECSSG